MANTANIKLLMDLDDRVSSQMKNVEGSLSSFKSRVEDMQPAFKKMAVAGTAAAAALGYAINGMVQEGLKSQQIGESFYRMTKSMGYNGDELISKLQEVSAGTVDTTSLMLTSNRAMALGVGKDMDTLTTLMEIARVKGRALGMDTTAAFNDIVTGIGRGSPLILDNLGITIKLGEAQEMYAQQLGKTSAELTDAEKKEALLNAVLTQGKAELEAIGEVSLTSSERMAQVSAQMANMKSTIGEAFLPILEKVVAKLSPIIDKLGTWIEQNPTLAANILIAVTALAGIVAVLGTIGLILPTVITGFGILAAAIGAISLPVIAVIALLAAIGAAIYYLWSRWDEHVSNMKWAFEGLKGVVSGVIEYAKQLFSSFVDWVGEKVDAILNMVKKALKALAELPGVKQTIDVNKWAYGKVADMFRANGGPVGSGNPYIVGERGPELFVPGSSGTIIPNHALGNRGGGVNITITGNSFMGKEGVAREIGKEIMRELGLREKLSY